jgi:hypothetical protein
MDDEVEKTAALIELVDQGVDFNTAVDLIKQAEAELLDEEYEQVKQAAVVGLLNEGMDIESAVQLVKIAMEVDSDLVKEAAKGNVVTKMVEKAKKAISPSARAERMGLKDKLEDQLDDAVIKADKAYQKRYRASQKKGDAGSIGYDVRNALNEGQYAAHEAALKAKAYGSYAVKKYGPAAAVGTAAVGVPAAGVYAYNHREKRAAAVEYLLGQGYDVETALRLVDGE